MTDLIRNDGNYGILGNMVNRLILNNLSGEEQKEYRDYLQKKNPEAYEEFLKFEKEINEQMQEQWEELVKDEPSLKEQYSEFVKEYAETINTVETLLEQKPFTVKMKDYNDILIEKYDLDEDEFYNFNDTENMNLFEDYHDFQDKVNSVQEKYDSNEITQEEYQKQMIKLNKDYLKKIEKY